MPSTVPAVASEPIAANRKGSVASAAKTIFETAAEFDAKLPGYPVRSFDDVVAGILDDAGNHTGKDEYQRFKQAVEKLSPTLRASFEATMNVLRQDGPNWATSRFVAFFLSLRTPLGENSITGYQRVKANDQATTAAIVLHGLARLYIDPSTAEIVGSNRAGKRFELTQLTDLLSTCRIPGEKTDTLRHSQNSTHVTLWSRGHAYAIDIIDSARQPVSVGTLAATVQKILDISSKKEQRQTSVATLSSYLPRDQWAAARQELLATNESSFDIIESAISTIALHESDPPTTDERLRLGRAGERNLHADQTLGFTVFSDGGVSGRVDHTIADGGVYGFFGQILTEHWAEVASTANSTAEPETIKEVEFSELKNSVSPPPSLPKARAIFDIPQNADVVDLLSATKMLNITLQLAFQAAFAYLYKETDTMMSEPTSVRAFRNGRCDPNYILTKESVALSKALCSGAPVEQIMGLFAQANMKYQKLTRQTRDGATTGPSIAVLRNVVEQLPEGDEKDTVLNVLRLYQKPAVFFTGSAATPGAIAAEAFIFAPDQLSFSYCGAGNRLTFCVAGSGKYMPGIEHLKPVFEKFLVGLGMVATSMACVEAMYPSRGLEILTKYGVGKDKAMEKGAIAIHAGAGEEYGGSSHEKKLVEFIMSVVTFVGQQEVEAGASSVDVAQNCVVALENCVFFNAGKGAVFTLDGRHELEASIVDGKTGESGAVAVLKYTKNPIIAARAVKDLSAHPFLTGAGADEFAASTGCEQVPNKYFHSHSREAQLAAVSHDTIAKLHPQTVGAVVLDAAGNLGVASSTGGVVGKEAGRIGDTAVVGAGVFADHEVAVACSGQGDAFLSRSIASRLALQRGFTDMQTILDDLTQQTQATGAAIMLEKDGKIRIGQSSKAFFVAGAEKGAQAWSRVRIPTEDETTTFFDDENVSARLSTSPVTKGDTVVTTKLGDLSSLSHDDLIDTILAAKRAATVLKKGTDVQRVSLVATGDNQLRLIPLHGLSSEWKPVTNAEEEFSEKFPGYIHSKNGPKQSAEALEAVRAKVSTKNPPAIDYSFHGEADDSNLFAKIVRGELEQWRLWESSTHVAFLTPFANTPGFTVVVPRSHLSSDILELSDPDLYDLTDAIFEVSELLKTSLGVKRVGIIFEGFEIDYAHAKLIPITEDGASSLDTNSVAEYYETYPGFVTSKAGPQVSSQALASLDQKLEEVSATTKTIIPSKTWENPKTHGTQALKSPWYQSYYKIQDTLFHETVNFFRGIGYEYAITPVTTDCISSPMGLGSDSSPVTVNLMGQDTYLADSMQFTLEYLLRFNKHCPGSYYIAPSFRGEDPDSTHLNQFFHVECELRGTFDDGIKTAEEYVVNLTRAYNSLHRSMIQKMAGTTAHIDQLLSNYDSTKGFPRVELDAAISEMPSGDCWEWVEPSDHSLGRKLTRKGERVLISRYGGFVWLTEMDHLSVPFYQAYSDPSSKDKALAADLLLGLGETLGLGERHATSEEAGGALDHHHVPRDSYRWYLDIRDVMPLKTTGWGMGSERYLCWLLGQDDVRDMALIPRLKGKQYLP
ncbi:uncharacterized protein TRUGW13939_04536 [Talaromyces rugulosus]|uniref:Aminoacyl-transfer RNA synthetases class-II family profile domain-containing protein n=1 Tax=Talaromyces rugulosus TaxID=121627 RepID=A0A7H8QTV5_TALRU|nr:uncharacterized protein TRUGW13939_04536 [Talaromyces rugulosus]QKX57424.1 hypothetical protein TRUGW13939_04536 [Talaromyces rugulosus]